jgi:magnesium chelatase subunit D
MMASISDRHDPWADAVRAAALLAVDPAGLNGAVVRAMPGPAREGWLSALKTMLPADAPMRRAPPHIDDDSLLGGLDLAATLALGRAVPSRGLLRECDGGVVVLTMAERCPAATAARIATTLDAGHASWRVSGFEEGDAARYMLVALDEGVEGDEIAPNVLTERLAFMIDLSTTKISSVSAPTRAEILSARADLLRVEAPDDRTIESICCAANALGVASVRPALFTLRAARAAAALAGRSAIEEEDLALAARLVLAPRVRLAPPEPTLEPAPPEPSNADQPAQSDRSDASAAADRIVDSVRSALPEDFLSQFLSSRADRRLQARARGAGAAAKSARRGRPLGARLGTLRTGERLDLVATLRAAAPWQPLRRRENAAPSTALVHLRKSDFRIRRFVQRLESTIIVVVDASGSAAVQRLAETKGAVETLLADAYITRSRVALIAFRDAGAELLLPPTRSLSRAKRALSELPGGGSTPLAIAIDAGSALALSERAKGRTPLIVLLTDGRGNVARDGAPGRARAEADARLAARGLRASALAAVFIDTSPRPRQDAAALAAEMGAAYAPLPFVEAGAVASVVRAHAPARR